MDRVRNYSITLREPNMHTKLLTSAAIAAFGFSAVIANAATTVNGGTVHFTGEIVNAACAVSTQSANQTVELGQYRAASLATAGTKTNAIPFQIKLVDCATSVAATAAVAFSGKAVSSDPTLLAVSATQNGTPAENVGIEISDSLSKALKMDGINFSTAKTLVDGSNILDFTARYVSTGAASAGEANASATFVVKYE